MTIINSIVTQLRRKLDYEWIKNDVRGSGRGVFEDIIPR
jgi:hypothetical protein